MYIPQIQVSLYLKIRLNLLSFLILILRPSSWSKYSTRLFGTEETTLVSELFGYCLDLIISSIIDCDGTYGGSLRK